MFKTPDLRAASRVACSAAVKLIVCTAIAGCAVGTPPLPTTGVDSDNTGWRHGAMVSAANPHAVEAAMRVLADGGHAVDAAIAAHAVLSLVEPQSSGIGGGAFMLVYERGSGTLTVYDGRETAPAGAGPDLFLEDGEELGFLDAWQSGVSVGVPGSVAMYRVAHDAHGTRPWSDVFAPAIELATDGFKVSPRLHDLLTRVQRVSLLDDHPDSAAYFYPQGEPLPVGYLRRNPDYARTLRQIAAQGPDAFYRGPLAEAMVEATRAEPRPGTLSRGDLADYRAMVRTPVCGPFRAYRICVAPPPSSGIAQIMIAGLYDALTSGPQSTPLSPAQAFVDAQRLAYADRDQFVADPQFVPVPTLELINPAYLQARATQRFAPNESAFPGDPGAALGGESIAAGLAPDTTRSLASTTHLSIVDANGNAVALTASVEAPFGSSRWVGGFLLNNQMTDFARTPQIDGKMAANAAAPGKRPRSSMSPTIVFDADGELHMVTGSPGGNSIVAYVAKSILGVLAWNQSAQQSIDQPNVVARGDRIRVETGVPGGQVLADELRALGYDVQEREGENSGLHTIVVRDDGLEGGADPRREGILGVAPPIPAAVTR